MARLSVNVDHVATVRQARLGVDPDPVSAAFLAELGGASGITVHLREDRRHIQDRDLALLKRTTKGELNLEMAATVEMQKIALEVKPDLVTLVPEKREELTTEGGLEVRTQIDLIKKFINPLSVTGIKVNLFINPDPDSIKAAHKIGADGVELHTGGYANKKGRERELELRRIQDSAVLTKRLKLSVHAGHGLDFGNIREVADIREITEFAIGFSIVARSLYVGMENAVREMKRLIG